MYEAALVEPKMNHAIINISLTQTKIKTPQKKIEYTSHIICKTFYIIFLHLKSEYYIVRYFYFDTFFLIIIVRYYKVVRSISRICLYFRNTQDHQHSSTSRV